MKKCTCGRKYNSYFNHIPICLECFKIIIRYIK